MARNCFNCANQNIWEEHGWLDNYCKVTHEKCSPFEACEHWQYDGNEQHDETASKYRVVVGGKA